MKDWLVEQSLEFEFANYEEAVVTVKTVLYFRLFVVSTA